MCVQMYCIKQILQGKTFYAGTLEDCAQWLKPDVFSFEIWGTSRYAKKQKACRKKYKPYILKYKALILK